MPLLSKPGLIPVKIENQSSQITTQVNKINFTGSGVTASVGQFNDVTVLINGGGVSTSASYALSASYAGTASYFSGSISTAVSSSYALTASYAVSASYADTASNSITSQNILVYCKNQTGFNITKGTVVRITGSNNSSDIPRITTASYENDDNSANTLGITNEAISNGSEGYVMTEGVLLGIDTTNYISGQLIYLGPTGSITGSAPVAPLHAVRLGEVIRHQTNNGSIYVRVDNGYELGELHNVIDNTTTSSYGDLLVKSGSVWINSKQLTGSYGLTGSLTATTITASNISILGTASISYLNVTIESSSIIYSSGSNQLGDAANDTQTLYGSVIIPTGSLTVSGSTIITGSLVVTKGITGSFSGSGLITSASYSSTSSFPWFLTGSNITYDGGNVGIAETNPQSRFVLKAAGGGYWVSMDRGNSIEGGSNPAWSVFNNATPAAATYGWAWYDSGTDGSFSLWRRNNSTTASLVVKYNRNNGFTAFSANVTVTGSATNSLLVKGSGNTSSTTALRIENSNASDTLVVRDDGYVGIGTASPSDKLTVIGSTALYNGQTTITGATSGSGYPLLVRNLAGSSSLLIANTLSSSFGGNIDISGNITGNATASMKRYQSGYYLDIHPEADNPGILPFYSNDIAYNTLRGGTFTSSFGVGSTYTLADSQIEAMFDGSPNYNVMNAIALSGSMTASIVFPQNYYYGNIVGFSFGSSAWRAKSFTVELLVTGSYYTIDTQTNYPYANYNKYIGLAGDALQGMRITFSDFASPTSTSGFRIAQIFLLNYNGTLGKAVFVGRDGGSIYKPINIQSGSLSAPAYSVLTDTNTGLYFPSADTIGFVKGGTEAMRITSAGNVGIGTSAPTGSVHIKGGTGGATNLADSVTNSILRLEYASNPGLGMYFGAINSGGGAYQYIQSGTPSIAYSLVLNPYGGNVGIGNTAPSNRLDVSGSSRFVGNMTVTGSLTATSFTGSLLGTSSYTVTSSYALTSSYVNALSQSVLITGSTVLVGPVTQSNGGNNLASYQEIIYLPSSIPGGGGLPTSLISKPSGAPLSMFIDYQIIDSITNIDQRTGTIVANFNSSGTPTSTYNETVTADIGNTSNVVFTTNVGATYDIQATNAGATPYTFKAILRYF